MIFPSSSGSFAPVFAHLRVDGFWDGNSLNCNDTEAIDFSGVPLSCQNFWKLTRSLSTSFGHLNCRILEVACLKFQNVSLTGVSGIKLSCKTYHNIAYKQPHYCHDICSERPTIFEVCACNIDTLIWIQILFVLSCTHIQAWNTEGEIAFCSYWNELLLKVISFYWDRIC